MHSKNPGLGLFSPFWGQNMILKKSGSVIHNTTWAPNSMLISRIKTIEPIRRKLLNRRMNRPYSYDHFGHGQESYKRISQLTGIAVDNKNKIQYNLA